MANNIRWKRSDYISLGKAISSFNKAVNKLQGTGIVLPDLINYNEAKKEITTRKELNRMITSLKRFQNPMQQIGVSLDGFEVTKWELSEVKKARQRATRRLTGELAGLEATSTMGTGNTQINEINAMLNSYENVFSKDDVSSYKRVARSILRQGKSDYEFRKMKNFQENFISAYEKMGRDEIVQYAKSFRDPEKFWNAIKDTELIDLKLRYDVEEGRVQLEMSRDDSYYYELSKLGISL